MSELTYIGPGGRRPPKSEPRPLLRTMLGDVLRRHRLEQGRTLADVAAEARVSMPYLSEVERGRKEVSSEVLAAICVALRVDLADVLTEIGRDLAQDRTPARTPVLRLERTAQSRVSPPVRRSGDILLLAA